MDVRHERRQREYTTNRANVKPEKHTTKACRTCHHKSSPSVNLRRILLHGIISDDLVQEARARAGVRCIEGVGHGVGSSMLL